MQRAPTHEFNVKVKGIHWFGMPRVCKSQCLGFASYTKWEWLWLLKGVRSQASWALVLAGGLTLARLCNPYDFFS